LNTRTTDAQADRIRLETMWQQAQDGHVESIPMIVGNALISNLKTELAKAEADRAQMGGRFKDEFPEMRIIDAKIQQLNATLRAETERVLGSLHAEFDAAAQREKLLQEELDKQRQVVAEYEDK